MKRLLFVLILCVVAIPAILVGRQAPSGVASSAVPPSVQQSGGAASDSQIPTVWVEPSHSTVEVGKVFTVTVMITDASNLAAFEYDLVYAPSLVEVVTMTLGTFLDRRGPNVMSAGPLIDNASGRSIFAGFTWGHEPGIDGQGDLAEVRLRARARGSGPLALEDVQLIDPEANVLPATSQDGSVTITDLDRRLYLPLVLRGTH